MVELYFFCAVFSFVIMVVSGLIYTWSLLSYKEYLMKNDYGSWKKLGKPGIFQNGSGKTIVGLLLNGRFEINEISRLQLRAWLSIIIYLISFIVFGIFLFLIGRHI